MQARAEELTEHEEQLEAWKQKFKAEALRQIGEREKTLADWQAKLDRKKTDLEELQRSMEVCSSWLLMMVSWTLSAGYVTRLCYAASVTRLQPIVVSIRTQPIPHSSYASSHEDSLI